MSKCWLIMGKPNEQPGSTPPATATLVEIPYQRRQMPSNDLWFPHIVSQLSLNPPTTPSLLRSTKRNYRKLGMPIWPLIIS